MAMTRLFIFWWAFNFNLSTTTKKRQTIFAFLLFFLSFSINVFTHIDSKIHFPKYKINQIKSESASRFNQWTKTKEEGNKAEQKLNWTRNEVNLMQSVMVVCVYCVSGIVYEWYNSKFINRHRSRRFNCLEWAVSTDYGWMLWY